jgi:hypothetical protein
VGRPALGRVAAVRCTAVIGLPRHGLGILTDRFSITWTGGIDPLRSYKDPKQIPTKRKMAKGEVGLPYDSAPHNEDMTMALAPAPIPANPQPIEQVPVRIEVPSKPKY